MIELFVNLDFFHLSGHIFYFYLLQNQIRFALFVLDNVYLVDAIAITLYDYVIVFNIYFHCKSLKLVSSNLLKFKSFFY